MLGASDKLRQWREHPSVMVRELFGVEPDAWQIDALEKFPTHPRIAMQACAGPGKTALLAWIGWNFLLTRPFPMIGATSISGANLKANLWAELARWRGKSPLLMNQFTQTEKAIFQNEHPQIWRLEARTWPKDADSTMIGNSLAGLHAEYVMWLLDESGGYPDAVMPVCEGIFSGNPKEAHIIQAGNPTSLSGPLYRAATQARNLWYVIEITADPDDPKRTPRVSVDVARQQIQQYGADNPWVRVRIFGKFPLSSFNALIGPDEVSAAMKRYYREFEIGNAPMVLGVDVAREGDDQSVIFPRRGIQAFQPKKMRGVDSTQGAGTVSRMWADMNVSACFVDSTGGFGAGWIDQLRLLKRSPIGVGFADGANEGQRYYNKRTEMYFETCEWIRRGGALPESAELLAALTQTTYVFKGDRLLLEPKEAIKAKLGYSPDEADALALTFAQPVSAQVTRPHGQPLHQADYDPYANLGAAVQHSYQYDPFKG